MHHINIFECYFAATEVFFSFPHASIDLNDLFETTAQINAVFSRVQQLDAARADASRAQSMQQAVERDRVALQQVCC